LASQAQTPARGTAKATGIELSVNFLALADEVIE
jgi:hypothetical protein